MKAYSFLALVLLSIDVVAVEDCYDWGGGPNYFTNCATAKAACDSAYNGVGGGDCGICEWSNAGSSYTCDAGQNNARYYNFSYVDNQALGACIDSGWGYDGPSLANHHTQYSYRYCTPGCPESHPFEDAVTGECYAEDPDPDCEPDPAQAPEIDMAWDIQSCEWKFDECTSERGWRTFDSSLTAGAVVGDTACTGGCQWVLETEVGGQGRWASTSSQCAAPADPVFDQAGEGGCVWNAEGDAWCFDMDAQHPEVENCGYFNGEYVCPESIADDSCISTPSGAVVCVGDAPDPPTVNDPGPAAFDGSTGSVDRGQNPGPIGGPTPFRPWSRDDINNDGGGFGNPGDKPGPGNVPNIPPPETPQPGDPDNPGPDEPIPDVPELPDTGGVDSPEESAGDFYTRIAATPIGTAFASLDFSEASGACTPFSADAGIFGTFTIDLCGFYAMLSPYISIGAWFFWVILSITRFMEG